MSLLHHPRREEIAAALVALVFAATGATVWLRHDSTSSPCCGAESHHALDAMIPADAKRRTGTLGNGLRYFIRANKYPKQRAELRLVVNAGSVLEEDDQHGLAHALEHMLFRGT